jgi:hypothetical protein
MRCHSTSADVLKNSLEAARAVLRSALTIAEARVDPVATEKVRRGARVALVGVARGDASRGRRE